MYHLFKLPLLPKPPIIQRALFLQASLINCSFYIGEKLSDPGTPSSAEAGEVFLFPSPPPQGHCAERETKLEGEARCKCKGMFYNHSSLCGFFDAV